MQKMLRLHAAHRQSIVRVAVFSAGSMYEATKRATA